MLSTSSKDKAALQTRFRHAKLDMEAFARPYRRCKPGTCEAICCEAGTVLHKGEADVLTDIMQQHGAVLRQYLPDLPDIPFEQARTGGSEITAFMTKLRPFSYREALPPHFASTRCVFADDKGFCSLQRLSQESGQHPWWYKPLDCWLHPIQLIAEPSPIITIPTDANDPYRTEGYPGFTAHTPCGSCTQEGEPGHIVFREELQMLGKLLERDFLREIQSHIGQIS
ncbi:MAG TPA: hypothetical protein VFT64_03165 [Rickettsiales bacterium]|nr:hypothetical protein [Rickettsiales bacterium]